MSSEILELISSEFDESRCVLVNEALVVGLQGLNVWNLGALGVQVKHTENK